MDDTKAEKYISFSHHQPNGNKICSNKDTLFLDLEKIMNEKGASSVPTISLPHDLSSVPRVGGLRSSMKVCPPMSPLREPEDEGNMIRDNFMAPNSLFHQIVLYETKSRYYLVGSYKENTHFRVMKIDRDASNDSLSVDVDPTEYNIMELKQLLHMINEGNKNTMGLKKIATADGILGFIRFTRGYYLVLITEKVKRGAIGPHQIYSIESTGYVYIPCQKGLKASSTENRYRDLFFSIDFSDFYFSYSYDLTHTLQHNMTFTGKPLYNKRFAWNHYLMKPLLKQGDHTVNWVHPLIHGNVGQSALSKHGRKFVMTIIARRSRYFAGTRYLKRGVNMKGQVANDVETEQIAEDHNWGALCCRGRFSSYVQIRGSIPLFWGQDPRTLTPKPPIFLLKCDPLYAATKLHFRDLYRRFGYPIVVLNLVKKKEKKPRESILRTELSGAIHEINEPLPEKYKIHYISWDFSRAAKSTSGNVITQMTAIAEKAIKDTSFFHSGKRLYANKCIKDDSHANACVAVGYGNKDEGKLQSGVLRSNCIDSLDRTNAAQFVVGKVAMGYQLYALGLITTPEIDFDGKIGEELTFLYQAMGNTLAMQYGGSELAHTMKSYTPSTKESSRGLGNKPRDIFTSFRRYYSNSFMDNEKQDKINLFLGNYKPWQESTDLWDLETDYYLHMKAPSFSEKMILFEKWWESSVSQFLRHKNVVPLFAASPAVMLQRTMAEHSLRSEAYDLKKITSFDKKLQREEVCMLEQFPDASREASIFYGRRKQWLTISPSGSVLLQQKGNTNKEETWNPYLEPHPSFQLEYYSIDLVVSKLSERIYCDFVSFSSHILARVISTPKRKRNKLIVPPLVYTTFGETGKGSQSLINVTAWAQKVARKAAFPLPSISAHIIRRKLKESGKSKTEENENSRTAGLHAANYLGQSTAEYTKLLNYEEEFTFIVTPTSTRYKGKYEEYQQHSSLLTFSEYNSPSHISTNSLAVYSKFL